MLLRILFLQIIPSGTNTLWSIGECDLESAKPVEFLKIESRNCIPLFLLKGIVLHVVSINYEFIRTITENPTIGRVLKALVYRLRISLQMQESL